MYQYPSFTSSSNFSPSSSFIGGTSMPLKVVGASEMASLFVAPAAAPASTGSGAAVCIARISSTGCGCSLESALGAARIDDKRTKVNRAVCIMERMVTATQRIPRVVMKV